jgi:carbamoyl-phosphate synthase large subunit
LPEVILSSPSNPKEVNVLFTSAGRRVELLRAFRRAYETLGITGQIHAADIDPLAASLQAADRKHLVPRLTDPAYIPALLNIVQQEGINLIFPLIDPDIPVLALHAAEFSREGALVMTPGLQGVEIAGDKWLTFQKYQELGIPAAKSWLPDDLPKEGLTFPLFIKPRKGSAGIGAFRVENQRQLNFFQTYVENPIIQECLPGPEITCDVVCSGTGELWAVVCRQRIEIRAGEVAKGVTVWDERIARYCGVIAKGIGARGPVTVQCILRDGEPFFTEINARFGGGCPLGIAAGADYPRWYLAEAAGTNPEVPILGSYTIGLQMTRFDDSFFLSKD